ncbi:hypothetical protein T4D_12377 [Trichinella pseudospiralis]|uniref:Uncharacterized protein n=1 Tax=Trichinella pseudospiralis TaxID=6337 RepID=A0A0V1EVZ8_TRIPS|nr:hypothetical protein T4D_12377 [Trichinella pseudospiralis]
MAFYKGLSEKNIFSVVLLRLLLSLKIKTREARSMAFYNGLSEKSKVHGDDFKN